MTILDRLALRAMLCVMALGALKMAPDVVRGMR